MNIKEGLTSVYRAIDNISIKGSDVYVVVGIKNTLAEIISCLEEKQSVQEKEGD